jgi:pilus assembly protein Flp/PilA
MNRRAVTVCGCSAVLALVSLAPATALADNPANPGHHYGQLSNPGHHYGQLSNPGHHYGQLKHQPSPPPAPNPAPPSTSHPLPVVHPAAVLATPTLGSTTAIADPIAPVSGEAGTEPSAGLITAVSPVPAPERNFWLTVIIVAAVLAANVAAAAYLLARGGSYLASRVRPVRMTLRSMTFLAPRPLTGFEGSPRAERLASRESGQGMVEYALILVLVSVAVIVVLLTMGNQIQNVFSNIVAALT